MSLSSTWSYPPFGLTTSTCYHVLGQSFDRASKQGLRAAALVELTLVETLGLALELGVGPCSSVAGSAASSAAGGVGAPDLVGSRCGGPRGLGHTHSLVS